MITKKEGIWGGVLVSGLALAIYFGPWREASALVTGCSCGREVQYIQIGQKFYNVVVTHPGHFREGHRHGYWDPQKTNINEDAISFYGQRKLIPFDGDPFSSSP